MCSPASFTKSPARFFAVAILQACLFLFFTQRKWHNTYSSFFDSVVAMEAFRNPSVAEQLPTIQSFDNRLFDSPTGDMYAFRRIALEGYEQNNSSPRWSCQIWLCKNDFSGRYKALSIPFVKEMESWDEIIWINDDLLYYLGFLYRPSMRKVIWRFAGLVTMIPRAHGQPVHDQKLYVTVRRNASQYLDRNSLSSQGPGGFFWLNPLSELRPLLNSIIDMKYLVPHYDGKVENVEAIYISPNPTDTMLYLVVYDVKICKEFAFILDLERRSVHSYLGETTSSGSTRPIWIDDETYLSTENKEIVLYNTYGVEVHSPYKRGKFESIEPSSDGTCFVGVSKKLSLELFRFGHDEFIEIVGNTYHENPRPFFSRNGQYVYFLGKVAPHANVSLHRFDVSRPMMKLYYGEIKIEMVSNETFTSFYKGKRIVADWNLSGQYMDATIGDILYETKAITVSFDLNGSVQTLPFDHVHDVMSIETKSRPFTINDTVIANRELRGRYYIGSVHGTYHNKGMIKVRYDSDGLVEFLPTYHVRLYWQNMNSKGRLSARYLGFTSSTWNDGTRVWSLPRLDNSDSMRKKAAAYLGIEEHYDASSSEDRICFITSSYGAKTSDFTPHRDVTEFQSINPSYSFFLFTNLDDLPARGWTKIVTNMPFKRFITHARYGKFLAWNLPEIQASCDVAFWVDTTLFPKDDPFLWNNLANAILRSKYGLLQIPHKRVPEAQYYGANALLIEMRAILAAQKDLPENVMALWNWFASEHAFAEHDYFLYENNFFGYDPKNPHFQRVSSLFWEQYSQEKESWRDQPLWAFYMHKERILPLLLRREELFDYCHPLTATGHNGHTYSRYSSNDAYLWYSAKKKWSATKKISFPFPLPSQVQEGNVVQKSKIRSRQNILNSKWVDLKEREREAALHLGFSEDIWNLGYELPLLHTNTTKLTEDQIHAAEYLGIEIPKKGKLSMSRFRVKKTKRLFFISQNPRFGSATMRGTQFIDEWNRGHGNELEETNQWEYSLHHCANIIPCAEICVFVGPCSSPELPRSSCCKVKVLDVIDKYLYNSEIIDANLDMYDALVVNSNFMKSHFREEHNFSGEILVLLHHSDPRWYKGRKEEKSIKPSLNFGYIGSLPSLQHTHNFLHWEELIRFYSISFVDTDQGHLPADVDFECDLSIRPINTTTSKFKTSAKVATAAAMGHNIITTIDEAVKDSLPPDYPFLLQNSSLSAVKEMMNRAINDYESDRVLWNKGQKIMKEANDTLSLSRLAIKYRKFLLHLKPRKKERKFGLKEFDQKELVKCEEGEIRYFRIYPDVKENWNGSAIDHYKKFGEKEGRFYHCYM